MFNPDYKDFFECVLHQHQCSILSIMSPSFPVVEDEEVAKMNAFTSWHYRTEHTKEFLSLVQVRQPEYLLLDMYADIYLGVVEVIEGYFTYNPKFKDVSPMKEAEVVWRLTSHFEPYFKVWMQHIDAFFQFLHEKIPQCRLILVKARFVDQFADGGSLNEWRAERKYPTVDVERLNGIWDMLDAYMENRFDIQVLDMTQKDYKLDREHPWGGFYVHYTKDFYHDFLQKLTGFTHGDDI